MHAPSSHLACMVGHPSICSQRFLSRCLSCNAPDESLPALLAEKGNTDGWSALHDAADCREVGCPTADDNMGQAGGRDSSNGGKGNGVQDMTGHAACDLWRIFPPRIGADSLWLISVPNCGGFLGFGRGPGVAISFTSGWRISWRKSDGKVTDFVYVMKSLMAPRPPRRKNKIHAFFTCRFLRKVLKIHLPFHRLPWPENPPPLTYIARCKSCPGGLAYPCDIPKRLR